MVRLRRKPSWKLVGYKCWKFMMGDKGLSLYPLTFGATHRFQKWNSRFWETLLLHIFLGSPAQQEILVV
jgi:hypothetical protein